MRAAGRALSRAAPSPSVCWPPPRARPTVMAGMLDKLFEGLKGRSESFQAPTILPDPRSNALVVAGARDATEYAQQRGRVYDAIPYDPRLESSALGVQSVIMETADQNAYDREHGIAARHYLTMVRPDDASWIIEKLREPIAGRVRKATGGTLYKTGVVSGTVSSTTGFSATVQMIPDS